MGRILGIPESRAGLFTSFVYRASRRMFAKVAESRTIKAHHPKIFFGAPMMERAEANARLVPGKLKALGEIRAATMSSDGCNPSLRRRTRGAHIADRVAELPRAF